MPSFPSDFPECNAYSCFMETEATASVQNAELRPPSVRPFSVPIPPPWDAVWYSYGKKFPGLVDNQSFPKILNSVNSDDNLTSNSHEACHKAPCFSNGVLFNGLVPRTSYLLSQVLSGINEGHLLIFPNMPDKTKCISKIMKDKEILNQRQNVSLSLLEDTHKLCFVRVLLRAYKEGVFEEGAVVCAPHISDLSFWTSRYFLSLELFSKPGSFHSYFLICIHEYNY